MNKNKPFKLIIVLIFVSLLFVLVGVNRNTQAQGNPPNMLTAEDFPSGSAPRVFLYDDPVNTNVKVPSEHTVDELSSAGADFVIDYVAAGGEDLWETECLAFPAGAKTAFEAAAAIWSSKIQSEVPVTIRACWSDFGDPYILGYSGGGDYFYDVDNAPDPFVWYQSALANSIAGEDLYPSGYDMHITYNSGFSWYYGTDANPPVNQYDLVTVAAHEIAHGLHFAGMADYNSPAGQATLGYYGMPSIYDTFIEDGEGTRLTFYPNPSVGLRDAFTSDDLWFDGVNANAANGGRVKIYAPATWSGGSSYAHLDFATFSGDPDNNMMVFAIGSGSANHNPGAVTLGMFEDMGWEILDPPINDDFVDAVIIYKDTTISDFNTRGATNEDNDPLVTACGIGQGKATVWYKYTHPLDGSASAIAVNTEGAVYETGTFVAVWTGSWGSLELVACKKGGTPESQVAFRVKPGTTYYIEVGSP